MSTTAERNPAEDGRTAEPPAREGSPTGSADRPGGVVDEAGDDPGVAEHHEWLKGQRHQGPTSLRNIDSILRNHILAALGSRRMGTFDHKVVESFIADTATATPTPTCPAARSRRRAPSADSNRSSTAPDSTSARAAPHRS
ncbi:hypothetical protein ACFC58_13295 [Kitasatospora purpeofusca]|uniref:hypothetical protein n=1 Tax=Kitasatospora purpeofusca TaxID=67352 RepID=UPI0035DD1C8C